MPISVVAYDCADGLNHRGQFFADVFTKNPVATITTINHVDYAYDRKLLVIECRRYSHTCCIDCRIVLPTPLRILFFIHVKISVQFLFRVSFLRVVNFLMKYICTRWYCKNTLFVLNEFHTHTGWFADHSHDDCFIDLFQFLLVLTSWQ